MCITIYKRLGLNKFLPSTEQVTGLDRSWQRPAGVKAKLLDSRASNGMYYIEYTLQNPGDKRRHIVSASGMAFNGWYNRLYTITGQVSIHAMPALSSPRRSHLSDHSTHICLPTVLRRRRGIRQVQACNREGEAFLG
jgi:hypothetical protein